MGTWTSTSCREANIHLRYACRANGGRDNPNEGWDLKKLLTVAGVADCRDAGCRRDRDRKPHDHGRSAIPRRRWLGPEEQASLRRRSETSASRSRSEASPTERYDGIIEIYGFDGEAFNWRFVDGRRGSVLRHGRDPREGRPEATSRSTSTTTLARRTRRLRRGAHRPAKRERLEQELRGRATRSSVSTRRRSGTDY